MHSSCTTAPSSLHLRHLLRAAHEVITWAQPEMTPLPLPPWMACPRGLYGQSSSLLLPYLAAPWPRWLVRMAAVDDYSSPPYPVFESCIHARICPTVPSFVLDVVSALPAFDVHPYPVLACSSAPPPHIPSPTSLMLPFPPPPSLFSLDDVRGSYVLFQLSTSPRGPCRRCKRVPRRAVMRLPSC